jgi:hypothetical protein
MWPFARRVKIWPVLLALPSAFYGYGAAADGSVDSDLATRGGGTVFVSRGADCTEDYASELRSAGIDVEARRMGKLASLARFVGLPDGSAPQHLVIIQGYIIADHVGPVAVKRLLEQKPQIKGLMGTAQCPAPGSHVSLDAMTARSF